MRWGSFVSVSRTGVWSVRFISNPLHVLGHRGKCEFASTASNPPGLKCPGVGMRPEGRSVSDRAFDYLVEHHISNIFSVKEMLSLFRQELVLP